MDDSFEIIKICTYKGETYHVRDNGAIMRIARVGGRKRPLDNQWTYGNVDFKQGYMVAFSNPVHRIVATAFHGDPPTENPPTDNRLLRVPGRMVRHLLRRLARALIMLPEIGVPG